MVSHTPGDENFNTYIHYVLNSTQVKSEHGFCARHWLQTIFGTKGGLVIRKQCMGWGVGCSNWFVGNGLIISPWGIIPFCAWSFPCICKAVKEQAGHLWEPLGTANSCGHYSQKMLPFAPTFFSGAQKVRQTHGTNVSQGHKPVMCVPSKWPILRTVLASTQQTRTAIKFLMVQVQGEAFALQPLLHVGAQKH